MKKFKVSCKVTCSAYTEVFAASKEEAVEIASQRSVYCAGFAEHEDAFIIDEPDGEPQDIEVEA